MSESKPVDEKPVRHILSLSGGKDSTALALYMRDKVPNMEYAFCDTGEELEETYEYLSKIEAYLGLAIHRLNPDRPFTHYLELYRGVLPDPRTRWCTRMLKLRPFEQFIGNDEAILYVGIRADEPSRTGYVSTKPNIKSRFPFVEDGLKHKDIMDILENSGIGLPEYYKWRSRSGCYFCFYQQRREWVGLYENHPSLFEKAAAFERISSDPMDSFTWVQGESLNELRDPARREAILAEYRKRMAQAESRSSGANGALIDIFSDEDDSRGSCTMCHL